MFLLFLPLLFMPFQEASATDCSRLLKAELRYYGGLAKVAEEASVTTRAKVPSELGPLFVMEKTGPHWWSSFTPRPENFQGDPRWFPMLLGPETAYKFGFRRMKKGVLTAPTAKAFNQAIENANKKLLEQNLETISLRYYSAPQEPTDSFLYLKELLKPQPSLPIAVSGHYAVHDISYHALAILVPQQIWDLLRLRLEILFRWKDKIENQTHLSEPTRRILHFHLDNLAANITRYVDYATGNIGFLFVMDQMGQKISRSAYYDLVDVKDMVIGYFLRSTRRDLNNMAEDLNNLVITRIEYQSSDRDNPFIPKHYNQEQRSKLAPAVKKEVASFHREFILEEKENFKRMENERIRTEDFIQTVRNRIEALRSL